MANHILYIPWAVGQSDFDDHCDDWIDSADQGVLKRNKNFWRYNHGDGATLGALLWRSEIYVCGHGAPGDHTIDADHHGRDSLTYQEVANRLVAQGLKKSWSGVIKLHNCSSGVFKLGSQSFAAKFAQYMRFELGFHRVSFVGYTGAIDCHPNDSGGKNFHRRVTQFKHTPLQTETKSKWCKVFF